MSPEAVAAAVRPPAPLTLEAAMRHVVFRMLTPVLLVTALAVDTSHANQSASR